MKNYNVFRYYRISIAWKTTMYFVIIEYPIAWKTTMYFVIIEYLLHEKLQCISLL